MIKNMKYTILLFGALTLLFIACKPDSKSAGDQSGLHNDTRTMLAGHWIAMDFCSRVNQYGSVLDAMTNSHIPYAFGITFDHSGDPVSATFVFKEDQIAVFEAAV